VIGVQYPAYEPTRRPIRSSCSRSGSATDDIVQFQDIPSERRPDFGAGFEQTFGRLTPWEAGAAPGDAPDGPPTAGVGAVDKTNLAFPQMIAGYDVRYDTAHEDPVAGREQRVQSTLNQKRLRGQKWYRKCRATGAIPKASTYSAGAADEDNGGRKTGGGTAVLPPSSAAGMAKISRTGKIPGPRKRPWTQQEKADEVSAKIIELA